MALFEIQGTDGATYEIDAPDEAAAVKAFQDLSQRGPDVKPVSEATQQGRQSGYWGTSNTALDTMLAGLPSKFNAGMSSLIEGTANGLSGNGFDYATPYNNSLEFQRGSQGQFEKDNPDRAMIGKGTGIASGVAMLPGIGQGVKGAIGTGAMYGGATGALQDAGSMEERVSNTVKGAGSGAAVGGLLGMGTKGLNKILTPNPTSAETQRLAGILQNEGVNLTAGQKTNSENLRYLESELGGATAGQAMEKQAEQFTASALKRAGIKANRATPEVLDKAFTNIGKTYDDLAARNELIPDVQLTDDFQNIVRDYMDQVGNEARPVVWKAAENVFDILHTSKKLTGTEYKSASSAIKRSARAATHPETRMALNELASALDDSMERSIGRTNPADLGAFSDANRQYRNLLVVEQAAFGAGQTTAQGLISPSQLRQATMQKQGRRNYARGKGEFANLARAGEGLMKPLPNSGTAGRTWARNLMAGAPAIAGSIAGAPAGVLGMMTGGLLGLAAPRVAGSLLMSNPVQSYLARQGATKISPMLARRLAAEGGILGAGAVLGSPETPVNRRPYG